ncbi:MAG: putative sugar nucleotidyl transferase [Sphingobacteriaceae bacterium]
MSLTVILFDKANWRKRLYPFVTTRPVSNLRVGIRTLDEKWAHALHAPITHKTCENLENIFPFEDHNADEFLVIRANLLPGSDVVNEITSLKLGEILLDGQHWMAFRTKDAHWDTENLRNDFRAVRSSCQPRYLEVLEHIFLHNREQLLFDFKNLTHNRSSQPISPTNQVFGEQVFVEQGAQIEGATLNSLDGPIYIGKEARIEEGSFLKGFVSIGERARVKTGARLYPATSIGPDCTVSGEINQTVFWGNSAKSHEGYLGCSVIGEGCNIGAGSSNSNLKNTWNRVQLFDYHDLSYRLTEEFKCGLFMGDHSMCAINSSFSTGTVIGVGSQIAISKFIPKFVPDFTWMTDAGTGAYEVDLFLKMIDRKQQLSGKTENKNISSIWRYIWEESTILRANNQHLNK